MTILRRIYIFSKKILYINSGFMKVCKNTSIFILKDYRWFPSLIEDFDPLRPSNFWYCYPSIKKSSDLISDGCIKKWYIQMAPTCPDHNANLNREYLYMPLLSNYQGFFWELAVLELCCGVTVVAGHFCCKSGGHAVYSAPHMRGPKAE